MNLKVHRLVRGKDIFNSFTNLAVNADFIATFFPNFALERFFGGLIWLNAATRQKVAQAGVQRGNALMSINNHRINTWARAIGISSNTFAKDWQCDMIAVCMLHIFLLN